MRAVHQTDRRPPSEREACQISGPSFDSNSIRSLPGSFPPALAGRALTSSKFMSAFGPSCLHDRPQVPLEIESDAVAGTLRDAHRDTTLCCVHSSTSGRAPFSPRHLLRRTLTAAWRPLGVGIYHTVYVMQRCPLRLDDLGLGVRTQWICGLGGNCAIFVHRFALLGQNFTRPAGVQKNHQTNMEALKFAPFENAQ